MSCPVGEGGIRCCGARTIRSSLRTAPTGTNGA
jgi:hypothetical protein